ncbi:N-acetyltransferase family protein [Jannaschia sp. 2305UL9-9]|uniref:GNAT family N-acetyltransferase n=1 Tax=Jannaschia sp. 2305UL9-9 TaxID=3121638 RepID=UPI003528CEB2
MDLRLARPDDGPSLTAIQSDGLAGGQASFREDALDWTEFEAGFDHLLVAEDAGRVLGFAGWAPTSARPVYAGVVEVSTYVATTAVGRGVGRALLSHVVAQSEVQGIWTLVAQIFPENEASLALHRSCGFRVVGTRERLGRMPYGPMAGIWRDVVMMERRAP